MQAWEYRFLCMQMLWIEIEAWPQMFWIEIEARPSNDVGIFVLAHFCSFHISCWEDLLYHIIKSTTPPYCNIRKMQRIILYMLHGADCSWKITSTTTCIWVKGKSKSRPYLCQCLHYGIFPWFWYILYRLNIINIISVWPNFFQKDCKFIQISWIYHLKY